MKKKITDWIAAQPLLAAFLVFIALVCTSFAAAPAARDYFLSTLRVFPHPSENGTNSFLVYDKTGTNWVGVSPTNASLVTRWQGTNYTALLNTNLWLTNGGIAYPVKIRNGLWVQ